MVWLGDIVGTAWTNSLSHDFCVVLRWIAAHLTVGWRIMSQYHTASMWSLSEGSVVPAGVK